VQAAEPIGRNLVICCDGTSNEFGRKNTNVVRLLQCLQRDTDRQLIYYDPGVGTLPDPSRITRAGKMWSRIVGLGFGHGLTANVLEAYAYLMETWQPGDRVYIFGFSRGAYTARVLAGLLHTLGLMPHGAHNLLPYLIKGYRSLSDRTAGGDMSVRDEVYRDFRRTFARPTASEDHERHFPVHFLGMWDTVSTIGWVWDPKSFRHTAYNPSIRFARHAVALDECRIFFRQNRISFARSRPDMERDLHGDEIPRVIECWFPGSHCDVGGGLPRGEDQLWPLSLEWMLDEAQKAQLLIDPDRRRSVFQGANPAAPWTLKHHESLEGAWKFAEYFPALRWRKDYQTGKWRSRFEVGRGTPRKVRPNELIHRSALDRLRAPEVWLPDDTKGPYNPRSLCVTYVKEVRNSSSQFPDYAKYQPAMCGCEACERLKASRP
jgi:uncharacterized protein (DUF2235 family)